MKNSPDKGKNTPSDDRSPALQIARRLINSRRAGSAGDGSAARAAAASCDHLYQELSRWVGPDGCHALFTRALAEARAEHSALAQIHLQPRSEHYIDGVAESIMAHGDRETGDALESMLARLVELLGRLIGDDMAMKLIGQSLEFERSGTPSVKRREEA
jgi:hypothetical protein